MIRLGKLTDYGLVLMSYVAKGHEQELRTARDLAAQSGLPLPTVSKLLKVLLQNGFLVSHRGIKGGYTLARDAREISVAEMIAALEGPIGLTECTTDVTGMCDLEPSCPIKRNQQLISQVVRGALEKLTLADLIHPSLQLIAIRDARGKLVPGITRVSGSTQ
jgi:FeS assembly SUF system regulator